MIIVKKINTLNKFYKKIFKKRPRIGFVSTGDELVSIKKKIKISQVYDSNRYLLHGLLKKYPVEIKDYGVVKDKIKSIEKKK